MRPQPRFSTNAAGGLLAGLIAGATSAGPFVLAEHWPVLGHRDDLVFYSPGAIFGIAISVYCWLIFLRRSLLRALGFVAICTATEIVAVLFAGILATMITNHPNSAWPTYVNPVFDAFVASCLVTGTIGAFLVISGALLLFSTAQGVPRILSRALCWSPLAGVLAAIGWAFGSYMSGRLWRLTGISAANYPFQFVFLAWQSCVGLALGLTLQPRTTAP
jgi:hypothetical protein